MTWIAYSARFVPKRLSVQTQPSGATSGQAFTTQPVVYILDGGGELCTSATNTVTVTKHSGVSGTLSGTTSVAAVGGVATFTNLQMSAGESGVSLDFAASGLTGAQSSTFNVAGGGGTATQFFNSSEANSDASNSDNLMSWDGYLGFGFKADMEGFRSHVSTPGGLGDVRIFSGAYNASGNLQYTQGCAGSIFYRWPIPANATDWNALGMDGILVKSINWGSGATYAFTHGELSGGTNSNYMGDYDFVRGVSEFYCRLRRYFPSDYTFGGEKTLTINPPSWGGNGGIIYAGMGINIGGSQSTTGTLGITLNAVDVLYNNLITLQRNHVYELQVYMRRTGANGTHIVKVWADDLGTPGSISLPSGGNMTNRLNVTNATISPVQGGYTQFGNIWPECWSNPVSSAAAPGPQYTNVLAREFNGGTAGNAPILCRTA